MARIEKTHTDAPWRVLKMLPNGNYEQVGDTHQKAEDARRYARSNCSQVGLITAKMTYEVVWDGPKPQPKPKPAPAKDAQE